ncbi:putative bifunctional diguanylate cyclase/phosphodiesterase [Marinobacterium sp. BA1]|uniref:putative bifunctional diguanylate cyclase/phosphodiesterase n=1 Tax=Marinobacterium sp. BA1 TaxID=3138931 RepID=UPI0032E7654F
MRAGKTILMMFLLPALLVLFLGILLGYLSLNSLRQQQQDSSAALALDLATIHQEASFNRDIAHLHSRVIKALDGARNGELTEVEVYYAHRDFVDELAEINTRVETLRQSSLLKEVNHNSVTRLAEEFEAYRNMMIMATEIAAVDPDTANRFFATAQHSYNDFSQFTGRISVLLTERALQREQESQTRYDQTFLRILVMSLLAALVITLIVIVVARMISSRVRDIADALSQLAYNQSANLKLPAIERLQRKSKGEFGRIAGVLLGFRDDLVRRIQAEEANHRLIFYDALTELPNRRMLQEQLIHLTSSERMKNYYALLWIDLDRFKLLNDIRGHQAGDNFLFELARKIRTLLREGDLLARVGGDEFAVLVELPQSNRSLAAREAEQIAQELRCGLEGEYSIEDFNHFLSVSIGIALFTERQFESEALLGQAELAKYQAKAAGRNTVSFYDPQIQAEISQRAELETELRQAIDRNELELFYQLQFDHRSQPIGAEALLRWRHSEKGLVSPAQFIPLAEETGLIVPIGSWVLKTACEQLCRWQGNPLTAHLQLAVNVSARQFRQPDFVDEVESTLAQSTVPPGKLKIELTESTVLDYVEETISKMARLREHGVKFSMDDFGTGYSSLQYLKRLPLDQIKIDQSFVRDIDTDNDDAMIIKTIIAMGHALSLDVIAEGVETEQQRTILEAYGCQHYQGYLFARPLPLTECEQLLQAGPKPVH